MRARKASTEPTTMIRIFLFRHRRPEFSRVRWYERCLIFEAVAAFPKFLANFWQTTPFGEFIQLSNLMNFQQ